MYFDRGQRGFGLVETIVGIAIFTILSVSIYAGFVKILQGVQVLKVKNLAISLATEQIEIIRNLPYVDVGIVNGLPAGLIERDRVIERDGITFNVTTSIRSIDDPFDGQIGESPGDLSPADYKLAEVRVSCSDCIYKEEISIYTQVSPLNLETTGDNGALFINVYDASGLPVTAANVNVFNNSGTSTIDISEITNDRGSFQIVDAPPGVEAYEITVTKDGYSTDKTYEVGSIENPAPDVPHANVVVGSVTEISFAIDLLSELNIRTRNLTCSPIGNVDLNIQGSKSVGYEVLKYNEDHTTSVSGRLDLDEMEWDNYSITLTDTTYELLGASELLPIDLIPNSVKNLDLIVGNVPVQSILIQIEDAVTGLPVEDATVTLSKDSYSEEIITSRGFINQTDWSGGSDQNNVGDLDRYDTASNIDDSISVGDIRLDTATGTYVSSGELTSSVFDMGTTTNFLNVSFSPLTQPVQTGADSLRIQIATSLENTATTTWEYFGPDGTGSTYYTTSDTVIHSSHDGDRYLRYKVYLSTEDGNYTPTLSDISFTYASDCLPPGQVIFSDLSTGDYTLEVEKDGYVTYLKEDLTVTEDWQMFNVVLLNE